MVLGELDEGALRICRQNIRRNSLSGQVVSLQMDALSDPPPRLGDFDCLVCNPPYIPSGDIAGLDVSVRDYEPHLALDGGTDGLDFYRGFNDIYPRMLAPGGLLLYEIGEEQGEAVAALLRNAGLERVAGRAAHREPPGLRGGHRAGRRRPAAHARRGLR